MTIYQKVIAVVGMLQNSINGRASKLDLAPLFNVANSYAVGRLVVYNDVLYRCVVAHSGAWNTDHFQTCTIDEIISLIQTEEHIPIAPEYSDSETYTLGFVVEKDGELQQCTVSGSGDEATFTPVTLNDLIDRYQWEGDVSDSSGSGSDRSITLSNTALTFVDFSNLSLSTGITLNVTLPQASTAEGSRISDTLLRIDTDGTPVTVNIVGDVYFLTNDDQWYEIDAAAQTTILTFTYVGTKDSRPLWLVGRLTSDYK